MSNYPASQEGSLSFQRFYFYPREQIDIADRVIANIPPNPTIEQLCAGLDSNGKFHYANERHGNHKTDQENYR